MIRIKLFSLYIFSVIVKVLTMKKFAQFATSIALLALAAFSSKAAFTSMYVFGDALSATTGNVYGTNSSYGETQFYYGGRYCNGRVWVEVLAQRQGIGISNNVSYYGCGSAALVNNLLSFSIAPSVAASSVFVVWVDNADIYNEIVNGNGTTNILAWTTANTLAQTDELTAITTLYAKGVRTLIMPSVVDISQVPYFSQDYNSSFLQFLHNECITYNQQFANTLSLARIECPGLTIYEPNFYDLLNTVLTNGAAYGLTNALYKGLTIDALDSLGNAANTNGTGDNYVFWDYLDPSARLHEIMADETEQTIAPVRIGQIKLLSPLSAPVYTSQMNVVNVPVGLNGFVEGTTNLDQKGWSWTTVTNITSTSTSQSFFVNSPALPSILLPGGDGNPNPMGGGSSGTQSQSSQSTGVGAAPTNSVSSAWQSYRLKFPMTWTWP